LTLVIDASMALAWITEAEATRELQCRVIPLARSHSLSSYDATYLDLALRLSATLASFDRRLIQSAADLGVGIRRAEVFMPLSRCSAQPG
jgi:predicted nucleic acid-binding protein